MSAFPTRSSSSSDPGVEMCETSGGKLATTAQHHQLAANGDTDDLSTSSASSSVYSDPSSNDLSMLQAAALLTADCLGTGLLALPQDVKVLGRGAGLFFLILNLPVNWYAGFILSNAAAQIERDRDKKDSIADRMKGGDGLVRAQATGVNHRRTVYSMVDDASEAQTSPNGKPSSQDDDNHDESHDDDNHATIEDAHHHGADSSTFDFIGMTQALFHHPRATRLVMAVFYINIFLVLGDYILVMSHAVAAVAGESNICLPTAGVIACTLMFAFSQLRTMANLGRSATVISLSTLAAVVIQCLVAAQNHHQTLDEDNNATVPPTEEVTILRMLSALASIGFAVGSQKLFLNIRHEMKHRSEGPKSLGTALSVYGTVYVAICILAGPDPPSFLFDDIPAGLNRRVAGLFLWIHVSVSYAINSQAICASLDRTFYHRLSFFGLHHHPQRRWMLLTLLMAVSSYLVANVVPFFKDLVALIGALTSVPLSLLLPAILHRRSILVPLWLPTRDSLWSYGLMLFGLVFLILGLAGSLGSIELDWRSHGPPFACDS